MLPGATTKTPRGSSPALAGGGNAGQRRRLYNRGQWEVTVAYVVAVGARRRPSTASSSAAAEELLLRSSTSSCMPSTRSSTRIWNGGQRTESFGAGGLRTCGSAS